MREREKLQVQVKRSGGAAWSGCKFETERGCKRGRGCEQEREGL